MTLATIFWLEVMVLRMKVVDGTKLVLILEGLTVEVLALHLLEILETKNQRINRQLQC